MSRQIRLRFKVLRSLIEWLSRLFFFILRRVRSELVVTVFADFGVGTRVPPDGRVTTSFDSSSLQNAAAAVLLRLGLWLVGFPSQQIIQLSSFLKVSLQFPLMVFFVGVIIMADSLFVFIVFGSDRCDDLLEINRGVPQMVDFVQLFGERSDNSDEVDDHVEGSRTFMEDVVAEALRDDGELVLEEPAAVACTSLAERIASNLSDVLPTVRVMLLKTPSRIRIIQELSECGLIEGVHM
jgi:hypothetical protein